MAATAHIAVTTHPVVVNWYSILSMLLPVRLKNMSKTLACSAIVVPASMATNSESMARSVTTVPNDLGNDTPSKRFSTPHRANSPILGITKLAAYDRKMLFMVTEILGCSPKGSRLCFQRHPRNACASMPKGNESSIHHQFISSSNTSLTLPKLKSRYIQKSMPPPRASEHASFNMSLMVLFISRTKVILSVEKREQ